MKTLDVNAFETDPKLLDNVVTVLAEGGVVCVPCGSSYRIIADLSNIAAVNKLFAAKGRTKKTPSLVFIGDRKALHQVAANVPELAGRLAKKFWPGQLTILFAPNPDLPPKVIKALIKGDGKIGVRVPHTPFMTQILGQLGRPLLVSSANKQKKQGAGSPAQVRKSFFGKVDLFVDAGDLPDSPASTVIDVNDQGFTVTRQGKLESQEIRAGLE